MDQIFLPILVVSFIVYGYYSARHFATLGVLYILSIFNTTVNLTCNWKPTSYFSEWEKLRCTISLDTDPGAWRQRVGSAETLRVCVSGVQRCSLQLSRGSGTHPLKERRERDRQTDKWKAGEGGSLLMHICFSLLHPSSGDSWEVQRKEGKRILQGKTH